MQDDMEHDLCSDDPWLVLHKIDSPTKMRYIGSRVQVRACHCVEKVKNPERSTFQMIQCGCGLAGQEIQWGESLLAALNLDWQILRILR